MASLTHYGIKGMKWGVRRDNPTSISDSSGTTVYARGGKITGVQLSKTVGDRPSMDAARAAAIKTAAKRNSTDSLSNKELQDLVTRMNLEQQYSRLTMPQQGNSFDPGKIVKDILVQEGKKQFSKFVQDQLTRQVGKAMGMKTKKRTTLSTSREVELY